MPGQAALLVLKAEFVAGCDRFTLFVNPPAGQPEPISTTVKTDTDVGFINALSIFVFETGDFDEIRVGNTYADVVPWRDPDIVSQPQDAMVIAGTDVFLTVNAIGQTALAYQWRRNDFNLIDATNATLALTNVQLAMTGNYTVVVTNAGGAVTSAPALLTVVPLLIEEQPDSLAVGAGTTATFSVGAVSTAPLSRLRADGTLDGGFNPGTVGSVLSLAVQADGKILLGGSFTTLGGQPRNCIGRLNAGGTLDRRFNPGAGCEGSVPVVYSLVVQADGRILMGGNFTTLGGQPRTNIARLQSTLTVYTPPWKLSNTLGTKP